MLAQRTQKLIQELKPDQVLVQANPEWWSAASSLGYVESQEEFNNYGGDLDKYDAMKEFGYDGSAYSSTKRYIFLARLYLYYGLFNLHFRFGPNFNFLRPGLEMKQACKAAEEVGAKLSFLGSEMNQTTWQRL